MNIHSLFLENLMGLATEEKEELRSIVNEAQRTIDQLLKLLDALAKTTSAYNEYLQEMLKP